MLNNVKDAPFLATGDGTTDDRAAIQRAIIDAATDPAKAGIFFPAGTYRVSKVGSVSGEAAETCSLELNDVQDFMVMGEGPRSVVKLVDTDAQTGDWFVFLLRNGCQRVVFKDLAIDGNRFGLTNPDEQSHGIQVEFGTEDLVVDRCILTNCFGDGMKVFGGESEANPHSLRLRIENCLFQKNKRSGVVIQRAIEQIIIANCIFDANDDDNSIDIEPSSTDAPTDVLIHGCTINHTNDTSAVHLNGISGSKPMVRCKLSDNIILGGQIFSTDVNQLTIQNNIVFVPTKRIPVEVKRGIDSVVITGNLLINNYKPLDATDEKDAIDGVIVLKRDSRGVTRALVANNLCLTRTGHGIQCLSCNDVTIQGNMIVATGSCNSGIFVRSEEAPMDNISIRDNDVSIKEDDKGRWLVGIKIATNKEHEIGYVSVIGNSIRRAVQGLVFADDLFRITGIHRFTQTPVCSLNRIADDVSTPFVGIGTLPTGSVVVGGVTSRGGTDPGSGGGRFIAGLGDPNTRILGNVGDIFQRLDGTPGATVYLKETGDSTNTDWIAIRSPQKTIMWVNHVDLLPGDASVTTSFKVGSTGVGTGLVVRSSTTGQDTQEGRNKVLHMGLQVPPGYSIRRVRVCYELSNKRSFISQIQLAQEQTPQGAIVKLDDVTDHTNPGPICVDSAPTTIDPSLGEVLLSLRVNFGNISDKIIVRAVGLHLSPV